MHRSNVAIHRPSIASVLSIAIGLCLLLLPLAITGCARPLKFLELGDMHILDESSMAFPARVVQAMNAEGGEFALACGDLATDGKRAELERAKRVLDQLDMPYHAVIGNHDAQHPGTHDETLFKEVFDLADNSYHFVRRGIHFIAFDSGCGTEYQRPATPEALAWLRQTVAEIPNDAPVILFTHYPYARGIQYESPSRADVLAIFDGSNLRAVISAHFHGNTEQTQNGVLFTTTVCSSSTRGNHDGSKLRGFRVFKVDGSGHITTEFREVAE